MLTPNCEYINNHYVLPKWFNYKDIDWIRYYPMKDGQIYKRTENKSRNFDKYIYDDEMVITHDVFVKYLAYINDIYLENDITDEEMNKLLSIHVCDYDWLFLWGNPVYDKNSKELLLSPLLKCEDCGVIIPPKNVCVFCEKSKCDDCASDRDISYRSCDTCNLNWCYCNERYFDGYCEDNRRHGGTCLECGH